MDATPEGHKMSEDKTYMDVEDLAVYQRLCKLHIEVCDLSHDWPQEERYAPRITSAPLIKQLSSPVGRET